MASRQAVANAVVSELLLKYWIVLNYRRLGQSVLGYLCEGQWLRPAEQLHSGTRRTKRGKTLVLHAI